MKVNLSRTLCMNGFMKHANTSTYANIDNTGQGGTTQIKHRYYIIHRGKKERALL